MADTRAQSWTNAWKWYVIPALVLVLMLIADLAGLLEVLRP